MDKLTDLPNIGVKLAGLLQRVGIDTPEQLRSLGSKQAFLMISAVTDFTCINKLYAIESAIRGINKQQLAGETKAELLEYFRALN